MNVTGDAKAIASAFIKARGQMEATVTRDAKGNYGKYATLAAIVEATTEVLAKNGLAIMQEISSDESGVTIDTWLVHDSGAMMQFKPLTMPCDRKPQSVGSAATYGRRYALAAICGLAPDDDDGEAAQNASQPPQKRTKDADVDGDVIFAPAKPGTPLETVSAAQLQALHIAGREFYGDEWDTVRPTLVEAVSKGAVSSSKDLTPKEADILIKGIQKKAAEAAKAQPVKALA